MKTFPTLSRLSLFIVMSIIMQACPIGSCPFPFSTQPSPSFVLGYRNQIDTLYSRFNIITSATAPLSYSEPDPIFSINDIPSNVSSRDQPSIILIFGYTPAKDNGLNRDREDSPTQKQKLLNYSEAYGDIHFNRLVSGLTWYRKGVNTGRVVLEESLSSVKVFANQGFLNYNAGDDLSEVFSLAYTNPVQVAKDHINFSKASAGTDYQFVEYSGSECDLHGQKARYNKTKGMYKTQTPEPFQWYDGEYFPTVQYQTLSDVNFAEIPHLSAMVALIPKVFPSIPGDYSFTIEVQFTNGKILRTTTPLIGFSGQ